MMMFSRGIASALLQDLGGHAGADGAAAFADRKPQLLLHRDRRDQLDRHLRVVPRHHHLHAGGQLHRPRHVRPPQVKLRPIPLEERRMPPAFLLGQDVHLTLKLRVRRHAPRLPQPHPPPPFPLLPAPAPDPPPSPPTPCPPRSPSAPPPGSPARRPRGTRTWRAAPAPRAPPGPTAPRRPPGRTCSRTRQSLARSPAAPRECAPASAASARPPPRPRQSPRPSAPPPRSCSSRTRRA